VDRPEIDIVQLEKGKPFIFKAIVTVKPEVVLGDYKGIRVEKKEYPVTDEDVDKELENMRNANARMVAVEGRPAEKDDMVIIDYKGFVGEEQFEGGTAENRSLVLGSGHFIEGFEDQLIGAKAGDSIEVKVTFPEDYHVEHLAGEEAVFKVDVKEIKEKELPDLDDEFAKDVSEFETLEDLKKDIRKKLEERAAHRAKHETEDEVIKRVTELSEIDIPEVMIEKQIDSMVRDFEMQLMYQGLKLEGYLDYYKKSMEEFRDGLKSEATERVRTQLTLEKVSQAEGITASEEELDKELEEMAKRYKMEDIEKFKKSMGEDELNYIRESIIIRKTVDFLVGELTEK
jgi:trigger factor